MKELKVEGLIKKYPARQGLNRLFTFWKKEKRTVVNRVSVSLRQGEVVGLLGPNGAGKTTTFYMIVGLVKPNAGKIFFDGQDITSLPMYRRAALGIGYLPQEASVFRKLTVQENLDAILETRTISVDGIMTFVRKSMYDFLEKYCRWGNIIALLQNMRTTENNPRSRELYDFISEEISSFGRSVVVGFISASDAESRKKFFTAAVSSVRKDVLAGIFPQAAKKHFWHSSRHALDSITVPEADSFNDEELNKYNATMLWAMKKKEVREVMDTFLGTRMVRSSIERLLDGIRTYIRENYQNVILAKYLHVSGGTAVHGEIAADIDRICRDLDRRIQQKVKPAPRKELSRSILKEAGRKFIANADVERFVDNAFDKVRGGIESLKGRNLQKVCAAYKHDLREELMEYLNIDHLRNQMGYTLSGGERRRTEIARALTTEPSFLLLDEPFAGVDPIAVADIQEVVTKLKDRNLGVVISDHNVRETLKITDRAYILADGEMLISGTKHELVDDKEARRIYLGDDFTL